MKEEQLLFLEKLEDFDRTVKLIKWDTAIGKRLRSAHYRYEIRTRKDDPTKTYAEEWLEVKTDGTFYKINVTCNSALANETQLFAALLFPDQICGLISKEEY